jgi:hypothetical protein
MTELMEEAHLEDAPQREIRTIDHKLEARARQVERAGSIRRETYADEKNGTVFFRTRRLE